MAKKRKKKKRSKSSKEKLDRIISSLTYDEDVQAFFEQSQGLTLIDEEEENRLLRLAAAGDEDARAALVLHNLKFIIKKSKELVMKHQATNKVGNSLFLDAINGGVVGMYRAIDEFKPSKGCKLITYAAWHIEDHIRKVILFEVNASRPAKALSQVKNSSINVVPISAFESFDHEDVDMDSLSDIAEKHNLDKKLHRALMKIEGIAQKILLNRFGFLGTSKTYNQLSDEFDMPVDRVRQIENDALRDLYIAINAEGIDRASEETP